MDPIRFPQITHTNAKQIYTLQKNSYHSTIRRSLKGMGNTSLTGFVYKIWSWRLLWVICIGVMNFRGTMHSFSKWSQKIRLLTLLLMLTVAVRISDHFFYLIFKTSQYPQMKVLTLNEKISKWVDFIFLDLLVFDILAFKVQKIGK